MQLIDARAMAILVLLAPSCASDPSDDSAAGTSSASASASTAEGDATGSSGADSTTPATGPATSGGATTGPGGTSPLPGEVGAACVTPADCTLPAFDECFEFGAAGMGCTRTCATDDDCAGGYCADFEMAGFPLGKKCVRACETDSDCNPTSTCVCDMSAGVEEKWCSVFSGSC